MSHTSNTPPDDPQSSSPSPPSSPPTSPAPPKTPKLGNLTKVDLREAWAKEAGDFTPWLALEENLKLLADTIGLELQCEAQEKNVGPFRADILCKDVTNESWVLIENQLESTDHTHLGQLVTYAAGLKAFTIVWVSQQFTEEHRAALDWLNEITADHISFFGLEVELWRIGDSAMAPKFNIVSKPNDWSKRTIRLADGALTETQELYREYWETLKSHLDAKNCSVRIKKPLPQMWMNFAIGRTNFCLNASTSLQKCTGAVQLIMSGEFHVQYFKQLKAEAQAIAKELGVGLEWRELPDGKESHIRRKYENWNPASRSDWPRQHEQLRIDLEAFRKCFSSRVKTLEIEEEAMA